MCVCACVCQAHDVLRELCVGREEEAQSGTSLVVQRLRIHLVMQGTWV